MSRTVDRDVRHALGEEIRRTRDNQGLTRAEVVDRMHVGITVQALANYEYGLRPCTVERFVEICEILNVSAVSLLALALQRAGIGLYTNNIHVDLRAAAENTSLRPLRTWARNRLALGDEVATLDPATVEQLAILHGLTRPEFVGHLLAFTPAVAARR
jgi:transcriptional regulator with XRE-family HTH domain